MEGVNGDGGGGGGGGSGGGGREVEQVGESAEKQTRHSRWLQAETLVLIEAKRKQTDEPSGAALTASERWEAIGAYCRARNCGKSAYQCRKRWFALSGDYNKIRDWQRTGAESYWRMTTDWRRENRLPGSFDHSVFLSLHGWLKKDSNASRPEEGISEIEQDADGREPQGKTSVLLSEHPAESGDRRCRNPRWSLQESLILLAAKRKEDEEEGSALKAKVRSINADDRWEAISGYCRTQGCKRNAYQCRKRWSALLSEFKRVREWQKTSSESYWLMKNDKRKESKLPAIFDYVLFADMDKWVGKRNETASGCGGDRLDYRAQRNGDLSADVEHDQDGQPECQGLPPESGPISPEEMPSNSTARKRRKRTVSGQGETDFQDQQLAAVCRSSVKAMQESLAENTRLQIQAHQKAMQSQVEAHNLNSLLDRTQRKEQGEKLVNVLGRLVEAVDKMAERLV